MGSRANTVSMRRRSASRSAPPILILIRLNPSATQAAPRPPAGPRRRADRDSRRPRTPARGPAARPPGGRYGGIAARPRSWRRHPRWPCPAPRRRRSARRGRRLLAGHHRAPRQRGVQVACRCVRAGSVGRLQQARRETRPDQAALRIAAHGSAQADHRASAPHHIREDGNHAGVQVAGRGRGIGVAGQARWLQDIHDTHGRTPAGGIAARFIPGRIRGEDVTAVECGD